MDSQKNTAQQQYLEEVSRNLQRAGFEVAKVENEEKLLVSWEGVYLCRVNGEGTVFPAMPVQFAIVVNCVTFGCICHVAWHRQ